MKCPQCGADSSVLETRPDTGVSLRRKRLCFNDHRFATYEVLPGAVDRRQFKSAAAGLAARKQAQFRKRAVLRNPLKPVPVLASELGISVERVRQIRKAATQQP